MFYGEFIHGIDRKGRLILPSRFRDVAKEHQIEKFYLTRGLDQCIFMFSEFEWITQEQKFKNMPFTKNETRAFNRLFFSGAAEVVPDKQGRFILPGYLKDYAQIDKETIVLGISNRIEIWNKQKWQDFYKNTSSSLESISENLFNG